MASIRKRTTRDGSVRYSVQVRVKKAGQVLYAESETFATLAEARAYGRRRDVELERPGVLAKLTAPKTTIGDLCRWYREEFEVSNKWQRSKSSAIRQLENTDLAELDATTLTSQQLVDHVRLRRRTGAGKGRRPCGPVTAGYDLIWIKIVLETARALRGLPIDVRAVDDARLICSKTKLIGRSKERDRRPTTDELARLDAVFAQKQLRRSGLPMADSRIPMRDVMWFAITSARRISEICRLRWEDNHEASLTGVVRDLKHPREKMGNHKRFKYTAEGWAIVQRQRRRVAADGTLVPYIFPFDPESISAHWERTCKLLGIEDLTFHDLRHEATSRLFESGYDIPQVAQFTLHQSWAQLKRYTNLRPEQMALRPSPDQVPMIPPDEVLGIIEAGTVHRGVLPAPGRGLQ